MNRNKKKAVSLVAAVALIGVIGVGATLAYFTDSEEKENIITMGHVDAELTEPNYDGDENNEIKNLTPGEEVTKDPTITLAEDSADAYVRAKLDVTAPEALADKAAELVFDIAEDEWFLGDDGYYYYKNKLAAGEQVVLFHTVSIPETWGNEVADQSFHIVVKAEAIQADNFTPVTNEDGMITAWQYSDGSAITAENYTAPAAETAEEQTAE